MKQRLYKQNKGDKIWWIDNTKTKGEHLFTFDKETIFNLFQDYPYKLTEEQREIFDKENPFWADYFRHRGLEKKTSDLEYSFLESTYESGIEEEYLDELQEKYGFVFPEILRDYYMKYNESVLRKCKMKINDKVIDIDYFLHIKYGRRSLEHYIRTMDPEYVPCRYVPFARNRESISFYWGATDGAVYTDVFSEGLLDSPCKVCGSVKEFFRLLEDSVRDD